MDSSPTLHDFVLNLLCDATARSAFELDPEGALQAAGLGDITAADVQEVIPLVVDYAPVSGLPTLAPTEQLTAGVSDLDLAGAVRHLQVTAQQLALGLPQPAADVNAAAAGAVTVTGGGLLGDPLVAGVPALDGLDGLGLPSTVGGVTLPGETGADAGAGLTVEHDPAAGVDAGLVGPVAGAVDATAGGTVSGLGSGAEDLVGGTAFGTLDIAVNTVTGAPGGLLDPLTDHPVVGPATSTVDGVLGSVVRPDAVLGDAGVDVGATLHGVGSATGVGGLLGGVGNPADAGARDGDGLIDLF
jgi:hypothetical protein